VAAIVQVAGEEHGKLAGGEVHAIAPHQRNDGVTEYPDQLVGGELSSHGKIPCLLVSEPFFLHCGVASLSLTSRYKKIDILQLCIVSQMHNPLKHENIATPCSIQRIRPSHGKSKQK
jgi:hypothetical protein